MYVQTEKSCIHLLMPDLTNAIQCSSPVNNTSVASIETYAIIGITSSISFVVFFSLGVLVAICIGCMVKRKSIVTPGEKPPVYETVEPDQIQMAAIAVEANYSYEIATNKDTVEQPYYIDLHV